MWQFSFLNGMEMWSQTNKHFLCKFVRMETGELWLSSPEHVWGEVQTTNLQAAGWSTQMEAAAEGSWQDK